MWTEILSFVLLIVLGIPLLFVVGIAVVLVLGGVWEGFWKPILHGYLPWNYPHKQ